MGLTYTVHASHESARLHFAYQSVRGPLVLCRHERCDRTLDICYWTYAVSCTSTPGRQGLSAVVNRVTHLPYREADELCGARRIILAVTKKSQGIIGHTCTVTMIDEITNLLDGVHIHEKIQGHIEMRRNSAVSLETDKAAKECKADCGECSQQ